MKIESFQDCYPAELKDTRSGRGSLQQSFDEEKQADRKLSGIAERQVDMKALLGETVPPD